MHNKFLRIKDIQTFGKRLLFLMLLGGFAMVSVAGSSPAVMPQAKIAVGDPAPSCTLPGLDGKAISLPEDGKGRAVIVHFWISGCRSCLREMPVIEALYQRYKARDLVVYAVNVRQSPRIAKAFADRLKITFPIVLDRDGKIAGQFGAVGVPRTYFVDRKGVIKTKLIGEASQEELDKFIQEIL